MRPARAQDAGQILAFIGELAAYERLAHLVTADEAQIQAALFGEEPQANCDIADWDGEAAGFCLWFYNFSTFLGRRGIYLEDLYVRPARRGHGIGKALLASLARRCVDQGLQRLEWSVLDWNAPAIGFYEGLGAKVAPDWRLCRMSGLALERLASPLTQEA